MSTTAEATLTPTAYQILDLPLNRGKFIGALNGEAQGGWVFHSLLGRRFVVNGLRWTEPVLFVRR